MGRGDFGELRKKLQSSLRRQAAQRTEILSLSPTETFPLSSDLAENLFPGLTNLYIADKPRTKDDKIIFGGRENATLDFLKIYDAWAKALKAEVVSMRALSGLHAHSLIFTGLKKFGRSVLLVPEQAGGHFSTPGILRSLGFRVTEMPIDLKNRDIDLRATRRLLKSKKFDFFFVDRTEALNYLDFSDLLSNCRSYSIFDASHFLSNILVGGYKNPFDMGFDLCIATLHKSFPGPQKALIGARHADQHWQAIESVLRTFISNIHPAAVYTAGLVLSNQRFLKRYASLIVDNAAALERELHKHGVPVNLRDDALPGSYFIFVPYGEQDRAYRVFKDLLEVGIETNYRLLPYNQGYGLRLGTAGATMAGLRPTNASELAEIFAEVCADGATARRRQRVQRFVAKIAARRLDQGVLPKQSDISMSA